MGKTKSKVWNWHWKTKEFRLSLPFYHTFCSSLTQNLSLQSKWAWPPQCFHTPKIAKLLSFPLLTPSMQWPKLCNEFFASYLTILIPLMLQTQLRSHIGSKVFFCLPGPPWSPFLNCHSSHGLYYSFDTRYVLLYTIRVLILHAYVSCLFNQILNSLRAETTSHILWMNK